MMKTRFAPSPTGFIHIGNARTALISALAAYQSEGTFLLRIEDTDKVRSTTEFLDGLLEDLHWLNLAWQEGEGVGGKYAPYRQSLRQDIYEHYYDELLKTGMAYPCYCTDEELELTRKLQIASGQPPRYAGTCRNLNPEEREKKQSLGLKPSLRFVMTKNKRIEFIDLVKGEQKFLSDDIGDFIIRRQDGGSTFMFCNAIDDSLMEVTYVIRGEDHLTNTPRQLAILEALNLPKPQYGHISLINGMDGAPLSKRNGSRSIRELRGLGYLPLALVNYLGRLGHYYESNELMNMANLAKNFSIAHLGKSASKYDETQLNYWQKQAVLVASNETLWDWLNDELKALVQKDQKALIIKIIRESALFSHEAVQVVSSLLINPSLDEPALVMIKATGAQVFAEAINTIKVSGTDFTPVSQHLSERFGLKGKALFQPLRLALTGEMHGPQMSEVFKVLGKDLLIARLEAVQALIA